MSAVIDEGLLTSKVISPRVSVIPHLSHHVTYQDRRDANQQQKVRQ